MVPSSQTWIDPVFSIGKSLEIPGAHLASKNNSTKPSTKPYAPYSRWSASRPSLGGQSLFEKKTVGEERTAPENQHTPPEKLMVGKMYFLL